MYLLIGRFTVTAANVTLVQLCVCVCVCVCVCCISSSDFCNSVHVHACMHMYCSEIVPAGVDMYLHTRNNIIYMYIRTDIDIHVCTITQPTHAPLCMHACSYMCMWSHASTQSYRHVRLLSGRHLHLLHTHDMTYA